MSCVQAATLPDGLHRHVYLLHTIARGSSARLGFEFVRRANVPAAAPYASRASTGDEVAGVAIRTEEMKAPPPLFLPRCSLGPTPTSSPSCNVYDA